MSELPLGTLIGARYEVRAELGRGGSATVYQAYDSQLERDVAVKLLHLELSEAVSATRFQQEIALTSQLQHPTILSVLDSGRWDGRLFYVMPYVAGETLERRLHRERQLPFGDVVGIARDVGDALGFAHSLGVVHRDVKPSNILLTSDHAWLCDFGVARALRDGNGDRLTTSGVIVGTVAYMSPEQATGDRSLDARTDIYSFGCVLYESLAGVRPFVAADEGRSLLLRMVSDPAPLSLHRPALPAQVSAAVMRAMERSPADRWQSVKSFVDEFNAPVRTTSEGFLNVIPAARNESIGGVSQERRRTTRSRIVRWSSIAGVVLGLSIASTLAWRKLTLARPDAPDRDATIALALIRNGDSIATAEEQRVMDAVASSLASWDGLAVIVTGAIAGTAPVPVYKSWQQAESAARSSRAGLLVTLEPKSSNPGMRVLATARRLGSGEILARATDSLGMTPGKDAEAFGSRIARAMLRRRVAPWIPDEPNATQSFSALRRFQAGTALLARWDLDGAIKAFDAAAGLDPEFALANLWGAQARVWRAPNAIGVPGWRDAIVRATVRQERLSERARLHAGGLRALADGRAFDAAAVFRQLLTTDSLDFVAWYLLAESVRRDTVLVTDRQSPSRWRFRASAQEAIRAYGRALDAAPSVAIAAFYRRTIEILPVRASTSRTGWTAGVGEPRMMVALPALEADTLVYVPYTLEDFAAARPGTVPRTLARAVDHGRAARRVMAEAWRARDGTSADAAYELALAMEALGEIGPSASERVDALRVLTQGLAIDTVAVSRARAGNALVRLRLKRGEFAEARAEADSILKKASLMDPAVAGTLAPIAALVGRDSLARELLERSWSDDSARPGTGRLRLPSPLAETMARHVVAVALGRCTDGLASEDAAISSQFASFFEPALLAEARETLLGETRRIAATCGEAAFADLLGAGGDPLDRLLQAALRFDSASALRARDRVLEVRAGARPSDYSWDAVFCEAWALHRTGMQREAVQLLDEALGGLAVSDGAVTQGVTSAGSLLRSLRLRAVLAQVPGFDWRSRRWRGAVEAFTDSAESSSVARTFKTMPR
jgi:serine/threonine-protein kinase